MFAYFHPPDKNIMFHIGVNTPVIAKVPDKKMTVDSILFILA
jgi:hypothetical protein